MLFLSSDMKASWGVKLMDEQWFDDEMVDERIDGMSPWELGFEAGVTQAEEEFFKEE